MPRFLLLPAIAVLVALASVTIVQAHSRPVRFDPAPGEVLSSAPAKVTGWFTSDIRRADESFIKVLNADGEEVQDGDVEISSDRREMSSALPSDLDDGRYLVFWSTFDDGDGEVFQGCYAFFVGQSAADAAVEDGQALDGGADCPAMVEEEGDHTEDADAPSIELSIPEEVDGDSATLTITPTNFTPRAPDGSTVEPGFGHYHIYLDKVPVDILTGAHSHDMEDMDMSGASGATGSTGAMDDHEGDMAEMPGGLAENPVMVVDNSYTFTNLEPGVHTVAVVLNYDDHTAYNPPVIASQTFHVKGGSDDDSGGIPAWTLAIGVIGGLVAGGVGMKLAGARA